MGDKSFWKEDKYPVKPLLRNSLFSGVRNPLYEGFDLTHSRRIGNFDVSGGLNLFTDEGLPPTRLQQTFPHQRKPHLLSAGYGYETDELRFQRGFPFQQVRGFLHLALARRGLPPSPFTNMGRESNNFRIDPFFNFTNPERGTSHKVKGRFYYSADNVVRPTQSASITDILGNMGTDAQVIQNIANGDYTALQPLMTGLSNGWEATS